jgi:hypothetical protein
LKELPLAVEDLQKAAELFREQGDRTGYQLAQETLKSLSKTQGKLRQEPGGNATAVVSEGYW